MGIPWLAGERGVGEDHELVSNVAKRYIDVASGKSGVADLATPTPFLGTQ